MQEEEYQWIPVEDERRVSSLPAEIGLRRRIALTRDPLPGDRCRVNIAALGDVGRTLLTGLRLLGGDVIDSIGICDLNRNNLERLEMEINQIRYPFPGETGEAGALPPVDIVDEEDVFDCDVFLFCASKGVPEVGASGDVRMAQLAANRGIISHYGQLAKKAGYTGLVCIISDPVDPLAAAFRRTSGLMPDQIRGYGLGVMNARACYYAERDPRFASYLTEGRAFGPHGRDLVIANSIIAYDDRLSRELTDLTAGANLRVRELGYKPYIAPAFSSAALSVLLTLRGEWHYSSVWLGDRDRGAYFGLKNRLTPEGTEFEDPELSPLLYARLAGAYRGLCALDKE